MVLCIIVGCSMKSGKHKDVKFFRITAVTCNQGEETEELTRERRMRWISAISREDAKTKDILQNERMCSHHFVSGRTSASWDKFNTDCLPTLNLGKNVCWSKDHESATERAERLKARRKSALEQQEHEVVKKRKQLNESGIPVADMNFEVSQPGTSTTLNEEDQSMEGIEVVVDTGTQTAEISTEDANTQTEMFDEEFQDAETHTAEFEYQFHTNCYQARDRVF